MHNVGLAVAVDVRRDPEAVRAGLPRLRPERAYLEGSVAVRDPGVHVVTALHRMHDVGLAVAVDVPREPEPVRDGVPRPRPERAYLEGSVAVRDPGVHEIG